MNSPSPPPSPPLTPPSPLLIRTIYLNVFIWKILRDARADAESLVTDLNGNIAKTAKTLWVARLMAQRTRAGHTLLTWAAARGLDMICTLLIDHGASVNYQDDQISSTCSALQVRVT